MNRIIAWLGLKSNGVEDPEKTRSLILLQFFIFLDMIGVGMILPVMPSLAKELGATPALYGLIGSFYGIGQLIGAPLSGYLSDRYGRKAMLLISFVDCAVCYGALALVTSFEMMLVCRLVIGLGKQTMSVAQTFVTDLTTNEERATAMGRLSTIFGFGFIIGPSIGSALSSFFLRLPLMISSFLFFLNVIFGYIYLKETKPATEKKAVVIVTSLRDKFMTIKAAIFSSIGYVILIKFIFTAIHSVYQDSFLLFAMQKFDFGSTSNGPLLSFVGILSVFVQGIVVPFFHANFSEHTTITISGTILSLFTLAIGFINNMVIFFISMAGVAIGTGVLQTNFTSIYSKVVPADQRGTYMGASSSLDAVIRIVTPSLSGILLQLDPAAPFVVSGIMAVLLTCYLTFFPFQRQPGDPLTWKILAENQQKKEN